MDDDKTVDLGEWVQKREAAKQRTAQAAPMVSVDERRHEMLVRAQIMLAAIARAQGRVRIARTDLEAVGGRNRLNVTVQENGDLVVSFVE